MASNVIGRLARLSLSSVRTDRNVFRYSTTAVSETSLESSASEPVSVPPEDASVFGDVDSCTLLYQDALESWVETLKVKEIASKVGTTYLHPDVFGAFPRTDLLHWNCYWQKMYRRIDWGSAKCTFEMKGGGRKPWPQKGMGKARHGSIRSPLWHKGGKALGPRGPTSYYFMLPYTKRVHGLQAALSCKFAQNDLRIVDSLDSLPTDDPKFLEDLCEQRYWGPSVLFVHEDELAPRNLTMACDSVGHLNIMPVFGLNVYSMLKHETVVLSLKSCEMIQERIIYALRRSDAHLVDSKYKVRPIIERTEQPRPL
ncbi:39S ribosomal protein L4, mitochondrial [Galendromus occidentalis]|uniref:Large ribosomal subunit protein uL4m n=1 Tax=Galendromus occidentalis TaxID=34638 RepID=A0AAJ6QR41_9ACAR|nr:39S ribosomal protein L4, mitochondrial [Galendromus occidentalis]